jgi:hypothetical protein
MRAGALALALLLSPAVLAAPAGDPDWHIPLTPDTAGESQRPEAVRLREALARYRQLAADGGWPELPAGTVLQAGQRDERVALLRDRLRISGDFSGLPATADAWFFDQPTASALQSFQRRHALPDSGQLDERTRAALNLPVDVRIQQLQATLTRWNWLPRDPGPRHLWINVVTGTLDVIDQRETVLQMRVIAGHPSRPTPSFQDEVREVVVNPSWSVPHTIAVEDLLPAQQADPDFFGRLGIRVLRGGTNGRELDARRIDWQRLGPERFPYRLLQRPGPLNSLGRYKLVMDNPWDKQPDHPLHRGRRHRPRHLARLGARVRRRGGRRPTAASARSHWMEVFAGEKAFNQFNNWLPDATVEACRDYLVGIKGPLTTPSAAASAR